MSAQRFAFGPFVLDMDQGSLTQDGRPVRVGNRGLLLLQAFLRSPGRVIDKSGLLDAAWPGLAVEESNLSVQIAALRKLLGARPDGGDWIATIPRTGYRFAGVLNAAPTTAPIAGVSHTNELDARQRPSIAVLPFNNMSGDKKQDYFADGITEDIITALTRFRWFFVIARNSSFAYRERSVDAKQIAHELGVRYLLEGSVRTSGRSVRISVQLVDATTGNHIWAERYDLELTDVFAIQDVIAERVAGAIEPELLKTESVLAAARHTGNMTAWDLVRQGTWHFHHVTREGHLKARELFRQALALDPELPEAHIWFARVSAGLAAYGWTDTPEADIRAGIDAAVEAIRLDEKNPYSHYALAITSAYAKAPEQAMSAAEKAVEICPSFALGHLVLGMARLFSGRAGDAITPLDRGLTLNPYDPQNFVWFNLLALAHLFAGQATRSLDAANKALKIRPKWRSTLETLAACYAALGRLEEARKCVDKMRLLEKPPGNVLAPALLGKAHWQNQLAGMLRQAGWNE